MNCYRLSVIGRVLALTLLCVGAIPFVNCAYVYAGESKYLDDPHEKVGLTYGVSQVVQNAYLWRGLHVGALNTQIDANVGYGGAYIDMWWNIGTVDWTFRTFEPEVDLAIGFNRWGLNIFLLYIHNFNSGFFDFHNYADRGNRMELDLSYTISSKIPLRFLWATRVAASDGYLVERVTDEGLPVTEMVRAWSSYAEVSYKWNFREGWSIYGAVGFTPWRSCYTLYKGDFAFTNIELRCRKDWSIHERVGLMVQAQLVVNPSATMDVIVPNVGMGVYLR